MSAVHRNTLESIPWLVNGRIDEAERRRLERHLAECGECRAELAAQQRIHDAMHREPNRVEYAPAASLQKLMSRIDSEQSAAPAIAPANRFARSRLTQWLAAAVIVEAIGITFMAIRMTGEPTMASAPPAYRTVTTTEIVPHTAVLRVVFAASLSVGEINALLAAQQLSIVGGPTAAGVYTLATDAPVEHLPQTLPTTLAKLRAHSGVRFAEPIGSAAEQR